MLAIHDVYDPGPLAGPSSNVPLGPAVTVSVYDQMFSCRDMRYTLRQRR